MEALIVVDLQNDFCPGGALAVERGDEVVAPINRMAREHDVVVATRDWHPAGHHSFAEQGGTWPVHCVGGTEGAELHDDLDREPIAAIFDAGVEPHEPGYDKFSETDLEGFLRERGVTKVHVAGLALDYCVKSTALAARRAGFDTVVHLAATRAVNVEPGDDERAISELRAAGVAVVGERP
jgi:nicotinamidase/pyrazinamidase